jgi:hypothetical protein
MPIGIAEAAVVDDVRDQRYVPVRVGGLRFEVRS